MRMTNDNDLLAVADDRRDLRLHAVGLVATALLAVMIATGFANSLIWI